MTKNGHKICRNCKNIDNIGCMGCNERMCNCEENCFKCWDQ